MKAIMTRGRWILVIFLAGSLTAAASLTYKRWPELFTRVQKPPSEIAQTGTGPSSVPPFSTKEPERYQATRIITSVETSNPPGDSAALTTTQKLLIARDGEKRREEFQGHQDVDTVYLEIPAGRFLLLPAKKIYADLSTASDDLAGNAEGSIDLDFSPERLLHESAGTARYERLGVENLDGRATTKYRVTAGGSTSESGSGSVTLIWIDDELGMPVRSETSSETGSRVSRVTMELKDVRRTLDQQVFELPQDYRKVDYRALQAEIASLQRDHASASPAAKAP